MSCHLSGRARRRAGGGVPGVEAGGGILVFEPNKSNPLIWLVHSLDESERGLLKPALGWLNPNIFMAGFKR